MRMKNKLKEKRMMKIPNETINEESSKRKYLYLENLEF